MGQFNLAYGKVFGGAGTFLSKKVLANRLPYKSKFEYYFHPILNQVKQKHQCYRYGTTQHALRKLS